MQNSPFTLTIHMVTSLDGYIAKKDNSISWFETADNYEKGIEVSSEDAARFLATIDCYIMGSRTYLHAVELSEKYGWPYGDKPTIVLTSQKLQPHQANIETFAGNPALFVEQRLKPHYSNVWLVGGAETAGEFIRLKLADELRLSVLPVMLGDGLRLFEQFAAEQPLHLKNVRAYKSGMVELCYQIKK